MSRHPSTTEQGAARSCLFFIERGRRLNKADFRQIGSAASVFLRSPSIYRPYRCWTSIIFQQKKSVSFLFHYCRDIRLLIF